MKLIDKDALVAEIDRQIELLKPFLGACAGQIVAEANDKLSVLEELKNFLNTLEVKEVDLDFTKEPVSEELEEAAHSYASNNGGRWLTDDIGIKCFAFNPQEVKDAFKGGANWQKEQFEKNRLAACDKQTEKEAEIESDFVMNIIKNEHRQPTFDDAIKYGMRLQKEQMMAKAIDGEVGY